jgi:putative heme iron utilization protein
MSQFSSEAEILAECVRIASTQPGGSLATMHAEDGTPYVTFVFFHLDNDGRVLFGSPRGPQHYRNIEATAEVSFLIDTREAVTGDWADFDRIVIEGHAERIERGAPLYAELIQSFEGKNPTAARFTERGELFCIYPRRLQLSKGLTPKRFVVEFAVPIHPAPAQP